MQFKAQFTFSSSITPQTDQFNQTNFLPWRECCELCQCAADENFNTASVQLCVWGWWKKFVCRQSKVLPPLLGWCSQPGWKTTYLIFAMFLCVANNLFIHDCIFRRKLWWEYSARGAKTRHGNQYKSSKLQGNLIAQDSKLFISLILLQRKYRWMHVGPQLRFWQYAWLVPHQLVCMLCTIPNPNTKCVKNWWLLEKKHRVCNCLGYYY